MTADQFRDGMTRHVREAFTGRNVAIRMQLDQQRFERFLAAGRYRTQFEPGIETGYDSRASRRTREEQWFGYPPDLDPTRRPVYGYLDIGGPRSVGVYDFEAPLDLRDDLSGYGTVQIILKRDVAKRSTALVGDSLGSVGFGRPTPLTAPTWESFSPRLEGGWSAGGTAGTFDERDYISSRFRAESYIETQIHGGVTIDDIQEVVLAGTPKQQPRAAMKRSGWNWSILPPLEQEGANAETRNPGS
ncbi:hypothetical protein [Frankia sp. QA3]|uniref:hypothetical protein n=1 Tax=Frankia sp. QA3 TaxID=710111 RepID=UPI000269C0A2|nr:hypothetical protein [Frankia sp. QA3]EIV92768.1 hypothetical protein FraQA3DRAFT_2397 [Frankia sp. QA3]